MVGSKIKLLILSIRKTMKNILSVLICLLGFSQINYSQNKDSQLFPDGSAIPNWFTDSKKIELKDLGKPYTITDYGVKKDSTKVQTIAIQKVIDKAAANGGGVIVIPQGVFLSGALFFKPKTSLYISEKGTLKGSDTISDYPIRASRMEGQNLDYFPALVNAYGVDHFSISGKGTINGNGRKYWDAFWARRKINPKELPDSTRAVPMLPRATVAQSSSEELHSTPPVYPSWDDN